MNYAGILTNDFINNEGVCVSYWAQGCPLHCKGCHNPQTWDPEGGIEATKAEIIDTILDAIPANGVQRNFSVLGGEPLAPYNAHFTQFLITVVRNKFPDIKIYLWTGYEFESIKHLLGDVDAVICGPYIESQRDITLAYRGSTNQKIYKKGQDF